MHITRKFLIVSILHSAIVLCAQDAVPDDGDPKSLPFAEQVRLKVQQNEARIEEMKEKGHDFSDQNGVVEALRRYRATKSREDLQKLVQILEGDPNSRVWPLQSLPINNDTVPVLLRFTSEMGEVDALYRLSDIPADATLEPAIIEQVKDTLTEIANDPRHPFHGALMLDATRSLEQLENRDVFNVAAVGYKDQAGAEETDTSSDFLYWGVGIAVAAAAGGYVWLRRKQRPEPSTP
ncbi:hypothetical protein [Cerasicoccus maritimus]|uniref:hypothetical protein n=1 Tax=Cerasicoccus maritimus TaxID=490089 RepID=UPI002852952A|nr:hypothetical protein [Cerasicoccus maritimus]